jgi:hypothetical protein
VTVGRRAYFLLEIRRASHSLNRSHRVCGALGISLTVHQTVSTRKHSPITSARWSGTLTGKLVYPYNRRQEAPFVRWWATSAYGPVGLAFRQSRQRSHRDGWSSSTPPRGRRGQRRRRRQPTPASSTWCLSSPSVRFSFLGAPNRLLVRAFTSSSRTEGASQKYASSENPWWTNPHPVQTSAGST